MDKSRIALLLEHQLIDSVINVESTTPEMSAILPQASTTPISETMFPGFLRQQFLQFPDVVRESMTPSNSYSHGLFPQINRAWIITDKTLYLWNYHFESDLCKYTVPKGSISNCFLATPRPGAFVESVEFVLVVVASYDIILLGVVLDGRQPENRLQLVDSILDLLCHIS
ncbi:putative Nup133 N terminal like protein [Blattamonas nauphoetae]|uniref:Nup133 N terminal like protein n=1 Tax=Blattamonas nauphoetae TaxID=2049346 RepID=A0ABQ9YL93_9EUKA|nr:putative Nup133 N terminal like protein [Blattamonas nauphoetae]